MYISTFTNLTADTINNKLILFHGTTLTAAMKILKDGFDARDTCWSCSDCCTTYFYEFNRFCDAEVIEIDFDDKKASLDDIEDSYYNIITRANEQGQIQNAFENEPDNQTVVIEIRAHKKYAKFDSDIGLDSSCENSDKIGSVEMSEDFANAILNDPLTEIYFHYFDFSVKCSLLYIAGLYNNPYAEVGIYNLPQSEQLALSSLSKQSFDGFFENMIFSPDIVETIKMKEGLEG